MDDTTEQEFFGTTEVEVIATQIAEYSPVAAGLADLRQRFAGVVWDLTTTAGNKDARAARLELVKLRTGLEAKRKELKAPATRAVRRPSGFITYVWDEKVSSSNPGYCFKMAGWKRTGRSANSGLCGITRGSDHHE